jgi:tetratricopeptide (TPR) repeat protein
VPVDAELVSHQPDDVDDQEMLARMKVVIEEAERLKASKNPKLQGQGYCLMGSALSKMGKRTEGLREYAKGLQLLYPGIETQEIRDLIDSHPAFQQPDSAGAPNPIMAERYFGEGSHLFWKAMSNPKADSAMQDFKDAEAQFQQAIRHFDKDARYQYYLGFAQLKQKKRAFAIHAFEQGARLEASAVQSNPFATREINQSLERIQGNMRELLNHYRYRPATEPETPKKDAE